MLEKVEGKGEEGDGRKGVEGWRGEQGGGRRTRGRERRSRGRERRKMSRDRSKKVKRGGEGRTGKRVGNTTCG